MSGIGTANLEFTKEASQILGAQCAPGQQHETMFANGPMFQPTEKQVNSILGQKLTPCTVLATYVNVSTDKERNSTTHNHYNAAVVSGNFGKGRLIVFGPHPEASSGPWKECIRSAVAWCTNCSK